MEVIAYKLVSGEDIIAEKHEQSDFVVLVKNPVGIGSYIDPKTNQQKIGLAPFPPLTKVWRRGDADRIIPIQSIHIVYSYEPDDEFSGEYKKIFGSGIIVPTAARPEILLG